MRHKPVLGPVLAPSMHCSRAARRAFAEASDFATCFIVLNRCQAIPNRTCIALALFVQSPAFCGILELLRLSKVLIYIFLLRLLRELQARWRAVNGFQRDGVRAASVLAGAEKVPVVSCSQVY